VTTANGLRNKPRMGRVPIVPWVRCAVRRCDSILAQRREPWQGDPIWILCRHCGAMNRVSTEGVWVVDQAGEIQPLPR
jgi:hypothetical protein